MLGGGYVSVHLTTEAITCCGNTMTKTDEKVTWFKKRVTNSYVAYLPTP